jgi:phosphoglycerol transferase MdoB-like AlkP superfamily enzyme
MQKPFDFQLVSGFSMNPSLLAYAAFFLFNSLKIVLYILFLIQQVNMKIVGYEFLRTLMIIVILYPLIYKLGSKVLMGTLYILQTLYIIVNLGYYFYFGSYLNMIQCITLFHEAFSVVEQFAVPLNIKMLLVFIDFPVFVYILFALKRPEQRKKKSGKQMLVVLLAPVLILAALEGLNYVRNYSIVNFLQNPSRDANDTQLVKVQGTVINNVVNVIRYSDEGNVIGKFQYGKEISSSPAASSKSQNPDGNPAPNYILIQVESMDANIVNQTYKGQYVTPFLHSLESQSIYYPYAMSYHGGGGTSDSEFSVLNSMEALQDYPSLKLNSYEYPNSLIKRLDNASYTTMAFHGNIGGFFNRTEAFRKIGYGTFYDSQKMGLPEKGWGMPDNEVFSFAFDKLESVSGPFLAHIITMSSHGPFTLVRSYYNNPLYDDIGDKTVKEYYNSFSYVDECIGEFVNNVRAKFKNTYIIIYGDHTPNIKSQVYSQAAFTMDGRYFEFVPMMVLTPDGKVRKETKEVASFLDVAPTVLETSGISYDFMSDGQVLTGDSLESGDLPFRGGSYGRQLLFNYAAATAAP